MTKKLVRKVRSIRKPKPIKVKEKDMTTKKILVSKLIPGMIVSVPSPEVARWETKHGPMGPYKLPHTTFAITNVLDYGVYKCVYYSITGLGDDILSIYVPNDYEFIEVASSVSAEIQARIQKAAETNLERMLGHALTSGSDPELFLENDKGEVLPAFAFLPGKDKPLRVPGLSNNLIGSMYWDGFQAEFTIQHGTCLDSLCYYTRQGLQGIYDELKKFDPKAKLSAKTVMNIPLNALTDGKDEHVNFGCMPSLNIYGMSGRVLPAREVEFRPAGGHIHFGFQGNDNPERITRIVKAMDAIIGVACVSLFQNFDDKRRRIMYGLAGEHRLPKHGLEYRVLSNAWMMHPMLTYLVFDVARKAFVMGDKNFMRLWKATEAETIDCINNCDVKAAQNILKRNREVFIKLLKAIYRRTNDKDYDVLFEGFINGAESMIENPTDIAGNWSLDGSVYKVWKVGHNIPTLLEGKKVA